MPTFNKNYGRNLLFNTHVKFIAGEHEGEIGYVSDSIKATAQITTGDDDIFTVHKMSLRVLAPPIIVPDDVQIPMVQLPRIITKIDHITNILAFRGGANDTIKLGQSQEINAMICKMFE